MDVKVEEVGPCKKLLKIQVPKDEIQNSLDEAVKELRETVVIPGFRKGRAPTRLIERRFGDEVKEDVKQKMLLKSYQEAVEKNKLEPIGEPQFDNVEFDAEKDMTFDVTLEVWPAFEVGNYKELKLSKKSGEPTEEELKRALEELRLRHAQLEVVDEPAKQGDAVVCDYEVHVGKELIADDENAELAATGSNIVGISAGDASKLLIGSKRGEEKRGKCTVTDAFPQERWRNKEADVRFVIKEVKRPKKPTLDDDLAKKLGYSGLDRLTEDVKEQVRGAKERWVERDLEAQIASHLIKQCAFELPKDIVKRNADINLRRQQIRLLLSGVTRDELKREEEAMKTASEEASVRDFKMFFILDRIAEAEKIFVTDNEVEDRISAIAYQRNVAPERLKQRLDREGTLSSLRRQLREEKTMKYLKDNAKVVEEKNERQAT